MSSTAQPELWHKWLLCPPYHWKWRIEGNHNGRCLCSLGRQSRTNPIAHKKQLHRVASLSNFLEDFTECVDYDLDFGAILTC